TNYMNQLDQVVQEANTAGLYVVLDLHDNVKSGSPYGDTADMPKAENIPFWQAIATHYKTDPMVMFDLYNEPKATNWQTWLHGGGTINGAKIVGFGYQWIWSVRCESLQEYCSQSSGSGCTHLPVLHGFTQRELGCLAVCTTLLDSGLQ